MADGELGSFGSSFGIGDFGDNVRCDGKVLAVALVVAFATGFFLGTFGDVVFSSNSACNRLMRITLAWCVLEGGRSGEDSADFVTFALESVSALEAVAVEAVPAEPGVEDRAGGAGEIPEGDVTARGLRCARAMIVAFRLCSVLAVYESIFIVEFLGDEALFPSKYFTRAAVLMLDVEPSSLLLGEAAGDSENEAPCAWSFCFSRL